MRTLLPPINDVALMLPARVSVSRGSPTPYDLLGGGAGTKLPINTQYPMVSLSELTAH